MLIKNTSLILIGISFLFGSFSYSESKISAEPSNSRLIEDDGQILNPKEIDILETKIKDINRNKSTFVKIVLDLETNAFKTEERAKKIFKDWQLNTLKNNHGFLIVASIADHQIHLEVGPSMRKRLPGEVKDVVLKNYLVPAFQKHDYFAGLNESLKFLDSEKGLRTGPDFMFNDIESFLLLNVLISLFFVPIVLKFIYKTFKNGIGKISNSSKIELVRLMGIDTPAHICAKLFLAWVAVVVVLVSSPILDEKNAFWLACSMYVCSLIYSIFWNNKASIQKTTFLA